MNACRPTRLAVPSRIQSSSYRRDLPVEAARFPHPHRSCRNRTLKFSPSQLSQAIVEIDDRPVVQGDPEEVSLVRRVTLVVDVEDPLLSGRIPSERHVGRGRGDVLVDDVRHRAANDLVNGEARDHTGCANGYAIGVADAELRWRGALPIEDAGAIRVDRLQYLVTRIAVADSADCV